MRIILKRYSALFVLALTLFSAADAAAETNVWADSLRVKWVDGKKYVLHKVDVKENWTSISRRYQVTIDDLKEANAGITDLKTGQIIHIPMANAGSPATATNTSTTSTSSGSGSATTGTPVYYTVKHGETLYSVSKRFGMTVEEMRQLNRLETDQLREGQQLVVKFVDKKTESTIPPQPAQAEQRKESGPEVSSEKKSTAANTTTTESATRQQTTAAVASASTFEKPTKTVETLRKASGGKTLVQVTETGVASWVPDGDFNQDKYYGLHRTAPIGTIIKVTNRMNNQTVYVKIVGVLPDTGDNDNVIIKVSQAVANKLNALDPLFRAELSYGLMQ